MKKLKLDLKDLKVESIELSSSTIKKKGSILGNASEYFTECFNTCEGCPTQDQYTCQDLTCNYFDCSYSCQPTCGYQCSW